MAGVLSEALLLVLLMASGVVVWMLWDSLRALRRTPNGVVRRVRLADQRVGRAHQEARRAMNDAAGQSWRNRFE